MNKFIFTSIFLVNAIVASNIPEDEKNKEKNFVEKTEVIKTEEDSVSPFEENVTYNDKITNKYVTLDTNNEIKAKLPLKLDEQTELGIVKRSSESEFLLREDGNLKIVRENNFPSPNIPVEIEVQPYSIAAEEKTAEVLVSDGQNNNERPAIYDYKDVIRDHFNSDENSFESVKKSNENQSDFELKDKVENKSILINLSTENYTPTVNRDLILDIKGRSGAKSSFEEIEDGKNLLSSPKNLMVPPFGSRRSASEVIDLKQYPVNAVLSRPSILYHPSIPASIYSVQSAPPILSSKSGYYAVEKAENDPTSQARERKSNQDPFSILNSFKSDSNAYPYEPWKSSDDSLEIFLNNNDNFKSQSSEYSRLHPQAVSQSSRNPYLEIIKQKYGHTYNGNISHFPRLSTHWHRVR